jgi:tRNA 2-thiouridine synthesizing protein A
MPVIKVQNTVAELSSGSLVEAICTDPGAMNDIPAWARIHGHQVVAMREEKGEYIVLVEVMDVS